MECGGSTPPFQNTTLTRTHPGRRPRTQRAEAPVAATLLSPVRRATVCRATSNHRRITIASFTYWAVVRATCRWCRTHPRPYLRQGKRECRHEPPGQKKSTRLGSVRLAKVRSLVSPPNTNFLKIGPAASEFSSGPISAPALLGSITVAGYLPCCSTPQTAGSDWSNRKIRSKIRKPMKPGQVAQTAQSVPACRHAVRGLPRKPSPSFPAASSRSCGSSNHPPIQTRPH